MDPFKQFQKNQADAIAVGQETVAPGVEDLFDQTFGPELGQVVAQRGEVVVSGGATQGIGGLGVEFCSGKGALDRDV